MISRPSYQPEILRFPTLDSTNLKLRELALRGAKAGCVVVAETQTRGRGRSTRVWHSPKGGLYCSFLLNSREDRRPTDLSILAGVAVAQTVKECLPKSFEVTVKWPNDCLIGWKKVAGVLSETVGEDLPLCIVGIGINVNVSSSELASFAKNPFPATSFLEVNGSTENSDRGYDLNRILDVLMKKVFALYEVYHTEGFEAVRVLWERNCQFIGKKIQMNEGAAQEDSENETSGMVLGICQGIDRSGALVLSNEKGEHHINSGEITCFWP